MSQATGRCVVLLVLAGGGASADLGAQEAPPPGTYVADAFVDPVAERLYHAAVETWGGLDESVVRYTARIQQRMAAAIRTPLKDRIVYRNETAVRAFWDRDHEAVVQVLGTRSQYPGRGIAVREGDLTWLEDMPFEKPFEPGGDRLLFGLSDTDEGDFQPDDDDFWFAHPLASGADTLYRFQSGDTLTLSFPDGRSLETVQLDVLPRIADVHRITGTLWIEPESGALVRAVYRLSQVFDAMRDVPELQAEEEAGSFKYVPGLFKPWTFEMNIVAIDYALWDFRVWLPRSMRVEGEAAAGILKMPVSMDLAYRMESVTLADDALVETDVLAGEEAPLTEVHFETREEAMAFIAQLLSDEEGTAYAPLAETTDAARGRRSLLIAPEDHAEVEVSPHLPPPIWEDAAGFPSDDDLAEYLETLADLPAPPVDGIPWQANWGWARPDLIRYNRVEGPAIGGRFEAEVGGPYTVQASGFFGIADLQPKARLDLQRSTVPRRLTLGAYRELQATDPDGRYFGLGNSVHALFFGRDDGEYFRATGLDLTWEPPSGTRESFTFRAYAERQESVDAETSFALFKAFDGDWRFRPNVDADDLDETGAELTLRPWWGPDPLRTQIGVELYGHAARWRRHADDRTEVYGRASATLRAAVPLAGGSRWRLGLEAGGGTAFGEAPAQRQWFLGGASTVRGYPASALRGHTFLRARAEVARTFDGIGSVSAFWDGGWAGSRSAIDLQDALHGIGIGGSVMDGLVRMDLSHGLNGSFKQFRIDLYLDALL